MQNIIKHIFLSTYTNDKLLGEYVYYLLSQKGRFQNISEELREYIKQKIGEGRNIKKVDFLNKMKLEDFNILFEKHLKNKLLKEDRKFDTYTLPSVITEEQFKNRSPIHIPQEDEDKSYNLIKDILTKGFPVVAGSSLYVFYIGDVDESLYWKFYENKDNLSHFTSVSLEYARRRKNVKLFMLENRDYFNTLLFLFSVVGIIKELGKQKRLENIIVWKKKEGEGSFFEIKDLEFIIKLLSSERSVHRTNLAKFLGYLFTIRDILFNKNKNVIDKILEEFSYYLLVKKILDPYVIEQTIRFTTYFYNIDSIRFLNKEFILGLMEEITGYNLEEYFELGQMLRSKIHSLISKKFGGKEDKKKEINEEFEKIVDRLAKDLRNELLPEYFIETLERDLVWLKGRGFKLSKEISEKLAKLAYDLKTSDLSKFYLIKASIILGLLSPPLRAEKVT